MNDGTRLWPDLDGRPSMAGKARTPLDPNTRNIYTFIPNGSGGGSVIPFTVANAAVLSPHMGTRRDDRLADYVDPRAGHRRDHRIDSGSHGRALARSATGRRLRARGSPTSFAGLHKDRRALIFVGANDGMIHAIDARTGYEVWAFIPYNLLPKLKTFRDGQAVDQFDYFVDSSPKLAEVKLNGVWRSLLLIGEGPWGTFYQTFDVTEAGMGLAPDQDGLSAVNTMLSQFDTPNESIVFKWAFPNYDSFDPTYTADLHRHGRNAWRKAADVWRPRSSATFAEKDRRI